jgi:hypothetical protein
MEGKLIANDRLWWVAGKLAVALCIFALPGFAHAANNCPWINEATVS